MGSKIDSTIIAFIEEIVGQISGVSASPGFTWGDSGNINSGSFLLNDSVPSNRSGRLVPLESGEITAIFVTCENTATFTIEISKRNGGSFTSLATVSLAGQRTKTKTIANVSVLKDEELACRVSAGSCKNPVVGVIIKGTST